MPSRTWQMSDYDWAVTGYYTKGAKPPVWPDKSRKPPDISGQLAVEVGWKGAFPQMEVDAFKSRSDIGRVEVVGRHGGGATIYERDADGRWNE